MISPIIVEEFRHTFASWRYVLYRSYVARKIQSKNSALGLLFDPMLLIVSSLAIAAVWNKLFGRGGDEFLDFFIYVFISFSIWNFITDLITGVTDALRRNAVAATNINEPLLLYIVLEVCYALVNFLMRLPIMIVLTLIFLDLPNMLDVAVFIYGVLTIVLSSVGFGLCIGMYCLFYGDLKDIVVSVVRVAFLLTPIIWHIERLGEYQSWIYFNPFYSYLTICRDPFLNNSVDFKALQIASGITVFLIVLGLVVLAKNKYRARERFFSL